MSRGSLPRRIAALSGFLLAVTAAGTLSADAVFGGRAGFTLGCLIDPAAPLSSTLDGALGFAPVLRVEDPLWGLEAGAAFAWKSGSAEAVPDLSRLFLSFAPADFLTARIGRFAYLPGAGGIASCTDWFAAFDLASLLAGGAAEPYRPGDMVQLGFSLGDLSLILTAMPFAPSWSLPDPDSPWFPDRDIPRSIHWTLFTEFDTYLTGITVKEGAAKDIMIGDVSVGVELSASLPYLDVSLLAYHGWDNTVLYRPSFSFPGGLTSDYGVELTPVARKIDAVGLDASFAWSSLSAWADASYTFSKTFLSDRLSVKDLAPFLVTAPLLEYAAGVGWQPEELPLILQAGYRGCLAFGAAEGTVLPYLAFHADAAAVLRLWEDRITAAVQAICSTSDWSGVAFGSLSFAPSSEFQANLSFPFFFGAADTELGQFTGNFHVSIGATAWF